MTNIDKYRESVNITEYNITSKLIFLRIIIPKLMIIRQLFHVKNVCKYVKNQHVRTDFLVIIIELLHFLHST